MIQLILGGARSGKSSFAEDIARSSNKDVCYIATATADDKEMADRIALHKLSRPTEWKLIEEQLNLSNTLKVLKSFNGVILIDCITLWLSNWMCLVDLKPNQLDAWKNEKKQFMHSLIASNSDIIIVSNEVGSGIVPMGELTRKFVDNAGWLNQSMAKIAERVILIVAGIPLVLKDNLSEKKATN